MTEQKHWRHRALLPGGWVTTRFFALGIRTLGGAAFYVRDVPYGRAHSRSHFELFDEGRGTCSTKHALVRELAAEQGWSDVALVCGPLAVGGDDEHAGPVLQQHGLDLLIDCHCVLDIAGQRVDLTFPVSDDEARGPDHLEPDGDGAQQEDDLFRPAASPRFFAEWVLHPDDIIREKTRRHRAFVVDYAREHGLDADTLWSAREAYIAALATDPS